MNKKYKLGIIGAGAITELSHLPVLKNLEQIEILWQHDKNEKRSALIEKMFNVRAINEPALKIAIEEIDICLLTIPYGVRKEFIKKCAALNKSIYVEKPFARTINEHEYYCKLFPSYKLAVGFQRRFYKIVTFLQQAIKGKFFGTLKEIHFTEGYFNLKGGNKFLSDINLAGGGVIIESAIHSLDQILLITAATNIEVKEVKSLHKNLLDYDTIFTSILNTDYGNVPVTCEISNIRNLTNGLELHFEHAIIKCQLTADSKIKITSNHNKIELHVTDLEKYSGAGTITHSFYLCWTEFINALNTQVSNLTSGNTSMLTTSWIDQIYNKLVK